MSVFAGLSRSYTWFIPNVYRVIYPIDYTTWTHLARLLEVSDSRTTLSFVAGVNTLPESSRASVSLRSGSARDTGTTDEQHLTDRVPYHRPVAPRLSQAYL